MMNDENNTTMKDSAVPHSALQTQDAPKFVIEHAAPPPAQRGMFATSPQRDQLEILLPGQVLRWRGADATRNRVNNVTQAVKLRHAGRRFETRKVDNGYDIYRTA
jgi:hypothetical protein